MRTRRTTRSVESASRRVHRRIDECSTAYGVESQNVLGSKRYLRQVIFDGA
jgi:hypothetical protein